MKTTIKIKSGKRGFILMVNGLYINWGFTTEVRAIKNEHGIPYGATEWVSVCALREFWSKYRPLIIHATTKPCRSVWGQLKFIENN